MVPSQGLKYPKGEKFSEEMNRNHSIETILTAQCLVSQQHIFTDYFPCTPSFQKT